MDYIGLSYNFDTKEGIIYISGKVDSNKIMRMTSKHGKKVKLCWINSKEGNSYAHMYQGRFYPPPPPPMPYYRYNSYDPMYAPHQHGYALYAPPYYQY